MEFERSKKPIRQISMVPLINVVFLLLIFFLVSGTVEKFDVVPVNLPVADSGQMLDQGHITILLGKYDEIIVNDDLVQANVLEDRLKKELAVNNERIISIKADAALEATKMIKVMNTIKAAGGHNLSLLTQTVQ